jgi:2-dehydropantoate 2-reductase
MTEERMRAMRYVIYGAGAIGGVVGGRLSEHGHDVVLVARGAHYAAIRDHGLTMETPDGTHVVQAIAVDHPSKMELRDTDVVFLCMKGQDTADALRALVACAPPGIKVLCTQNGVENERAALRAFPNVYGVRVSIPGSHFEAGVVLAHGTPSSGIIDLGRYPQGADDVAHAIAADLNASTFSARVDEDIMRWKYCKLLGNLGNAVEAVCAPGAHERGGRLATLAREEGVACYRAAGIDFASGEEDRERRGTEVTLVAVGGREHAGASSWQSLERRAGTIESDYLNGEIVLLGRLHGVPTPVNETLTRLADELARANQGPGSYTEDEVLALAGVAAVADVAAR